MNTSALVWRALKPDPFIYRDRESGEMLSRSEAFQGMSFRHFKSKDKREKRAVQKREAA